MFKEEWFASKEYTLEHFQRIFLLQQQQPFVRLKLLLIQSFTDLLTSVWQTTRSWKSVLVCFAHTIMGLCRDHARATCWSSDVKTVLFILLAGLYYAGSSTGYGTRRARGGRYVHLQHRAATWPEQPQIIQIVQAGICSDCTFYAIWCWMCLHVT